MLSWFVFQMWWSVWVAFLPCFMSKVLQKHLSNVKVQFVSEPSIPRKDICQPLTSDVTSWLRRIELNIVIFSSMLRRHGRRLCFLFLLQNMFCKYNEIHKNTDKCLLLYSQNFLCFKSIFIQDFV
jgi:hypothetical protein